MTLSDATRRAANAASEAGDIDAALARWAESATGLAAGFGGSLYDYGLLLRRRDAIKAVIDTIGPDAAMELRAAIAAADAAFATHTTGVARPLWKDLGPDAGWWNWRVPCRRSDELEREVQALGVFDNLIARWV